MLKRVLSLILFILIGIGAGKAQSVVVPAKVDFAGMKLTLNSAARKKVQADVDRLRRSPKFFQSYVDKANIYFPLIEQVFKEEGFPDDVKYLIIQESAFRADAVSSSNAVGYWQFKKGTAQEVGLRVDGAIDERKNIVSASRGAALYIKKNNEKLDNWVYALTAYNTGLGGVQKYVDKKYIGADKMEITGNTHWYFLKFLAHKIAFEGAVGKERAKNQLGTYTKTSGQTLKSISKKTNVPLEELEAYNRWISSSRKIPSDKTYVVAVPGVGIQTSEPVLAQNDTKKSVIKEKPVREPKKVKPRSEPVVAELTDYDPDNPPVFLIVNGLRAVRAAEGDELVKLAAYAGLTREKLAKFNEIETFHDPIVGQHYFITRKKSKGLVNYHTVREGEDLWSISQKYGMKKSKILKYNRMYKGEALEVGRVLWLRRKRPSDVPVKYLGREEPDDRSAPLTTTDSSTSNTPDNQSDNYEGAQVHIVQPGETMYSISRKYKVSVQEIMDWNDKPDAGIDVGEKLVIKK